MADTEHDGTEGESIPKNRESRDFLERAISACRINVSRHVASSMAEFVAVMLLMLFTGAAAFKLAQMQGLENSSKYEALRAAADDTNRILAHVADHYQSVDYLVFHPPFAAKPLSGDDMNRAEQEWKTQHDKDLKEAQSSLDASRARAENDAKAVTSFEASPLLSNTETYGAGLIFVVLISVLVGLYRMHVREIVKNEHYRLALLRVGIAAANFEKPGYDTKVRVALLNNAFEIPSEPKLFEKTRKLESPLPGHPTSDLMTGIVNKILEKFEVEVKPKE
jgi:hypothetical protein